MQKRAGRLPILGQAPKHEERADAARNRQLILAAARRLLKSRPIAEICMDSVASAAGVGKGTLYRRFSDRTSLCLALLDEEERQFQERAIAGFDLPRSATPVDRVVAFVDALMVHSIDNGSLFCEAASHAKDSAQWLDHPVRNWQRQELARLLKMLKKPQPHVLAELILAMVEPKVIFWQLQQGISVSNLRQTVRDFVRRGLR